MAKKLIKHSKLTNKQINTLIDLFVLDVSASKAAVFLGINRHSADRVYTYIRKRIFVHIEGYPFETNKSAHLPVFGIVKQDGRIHTGIAYGMNQHVIDRILYNKRIPSIITQQESFQTYDSFIMNGNTFVSIAHKKGTRTKKGINGTESFWGYVKTTLQQRHGVNKEYFFLYLKEMEFRFNNRKHSDLGGFLRQILKTKSVLDKP